MHEPIFKAALNYNCTINAPSQTYPFFLVFIKLGSKINELVTFWFELALPEVIDRWLVRSVSRRYFFFFLGSLTPLRL